MPLFRVLKNTEKTKIIIDAENESKAFEQMILELDLDSDLHTIKTTTGYKKFTHSTNRGYNCYELEEIDDQEDHICSKCANWLQPPDLEPYEKGHCTSPKFIPSSFDNELKHDEIEYGHPEKHLQSALQYTGPNFGCIHWRKRPCISSKN